MPASRLCFLNAGSMARESFMKKSVFFLMLAGASLPSVTHAQVSIDMARVTCAKRNAKVVGNYCKTHKSDTVMNAMQKNWR
jgi:acid stress chaperone HdeB